MKGILIGAVMAIGVGGCNNSTSIKTASNHFPSDSLATPATTALYQNLLALQGKKILFGHQDDLAYGVGWQYEKGRSDVKEVTGEYPALYGWELGNLELGAAKSLDSVPFEAIQSYIKEGYDSGAVITISWHLNNPLNGKSAWDTTHGSVASIIPGGAKHELYKTYLDKLAIFLSELKGSDGGQIPVLFRPFHEQTGNWFWWCQNTCTPQEYTTLWQFTVNYLRNNKQLHHILYVYNTSDFENKAQFMERYPGDDYVDVISFDAYQNEKMITDSSNEFVQKVDKCLGMLKEMAHEKNKLAAFAETGFEAIPKANWWTNDLLPLLKKHQPSYVLVWRNAGLMKESGKMHYYAPYPKQVSAPDFVNFYKEETIVFQLKAKQANLYKAN